MTATLVKEAYLQAITDFVAEFSGNTEGDDDYTVAKLLAASQQEQHRIWAKLWKKGVEQTIEQLENEGLALALKAIRVDPNRADHVQATIDANVAVMVHSIVMQRAKALSDSDPLSELSLLAEWMRLADEMNTDHTVETPAGKVYDYILVKIRTQLGLQ